MKINFSNVKNHEEIAFSSTLDSFFDEKSTICQKINKSNGTIILDKTGNTLIAKFKISFNCIVFSSYTNNPFETNIDVDDELFFTNSPDFESDEMILVDDEIDLDEFVYSLFITSIPLNLHAENEKLPSGKGYRVLTEDEFNNNKNDEESPFDKLKDLNFDD